MAVPLRFDELLHNGAKYSAGLNQLGLSVHFYAVYHTAIEIAFMLVFSIIAALIVWRKLGDWMTLYVSFMLITYGATLVRPMSLLAERQPFWHWPVGLLQAMAWSAILTFFYLFPDGQFVPRWTRWLSVAWTLWMLAAFLWPDAPFDPSDWDTWASLVWFWFYLGWFGSGLYAQFYRYLRVATPVQRQQTKWVIYGMVAAVVLGFAQQLPMAIVPAVQVRGTPTSLLYTLLSTPVFMVAVSLVPLTISISILRYRLFDIDILIRRSLVYTLLTTILGATYFALVMLFQRLFQLLIGHTSDLAIFASTLTIAALFSPLRDRLQEFIDRTFYRRRYDYRLAMLDLGRSLRTIIDVGELQKQLLTWLRDNMGISHLAILQPTPHLTVTQQYGLADSLPLTSDEHLLNRLHNGEIIERPAAWAPWAIELAVPLISHNRLTGVLALGPKLSELPYNQEDKTLLSTLADQVAAAITIAQLVRENQEKQRLEQELQLARQIQMNLLPHERPQPTGLDIAWFCRPAHETSGDFYDYIPLADGRLGLVVADVTGKGLSAAMVAAGARTAIRTEAGHHVSPAATLNDANAWLCQDMPPGTFIALVYAIVNPDQAQLSWANAGQLAPLLRRAGHCQDLATEGPRWPLGISAAEMYAECTLSFQPGDVIVLYTDGLVEAMNQTGEMYGFERLYQAMLNAPTSNAQAMADYLLNEIDVFVGPAEPSDDMTAVIIKVGHGPEHAS